MPRPWGFFCSHVSRAFTSKHTQGFSSGQTLGWGDLDIWCFTVCPTWYWAGENWQNWQGRHVKLWNIEIEVNPTHVSDWMTNPVNKLARTWLARQSRMSIPRPRLVVLRICLLKVTTSTTSRLPKNPMKTTIAKNMGTVKQKMGERR